MSGIKERIYQFTKHQNIPIKAFEEKCGMSNGYIASMRKGLGETKLNNVLSAYPSLSREWLLFGEGEMLKPSIQEVHNCNNNTQIAGNNNHVNMQCTIDKAIEEIAEQRKLTTKAQEQIDRLLSIIENVIKS